MAHTGSLLVVLCPLQTIMSGFKAQKCVSSGRELSYYLFRLDILPLQFFYTLATQFPGVFRLI
jgi:hypothetical protein